MQILKVIIICHNLLAAEKLTETFAVNRLACDQPECATF